MEYNWFARVTRANASKVVFLKLLLKKKACQGSYVGEVVLLKASGVSSFMFSSMHSSSPAELTIIKIFGCIGGKHVSADSTIHASTNPSKITKKTNRPKKKKKKDLRVCSDVAVMPLLF